MNRFLVLLLLLGLACDDAPTGPRPCSQPEDFTRVAAPIRLPDGTLTGDTLWLAICYTRGRVQ